MREHERIQELISAMVDGELSEEERREVEAHIASCAECQALYEAFSGLSEAMEAEELPDGLHQRIMDRVDLSAKVLRRQKQLKRLRAAMSLAAAFVVVIGTTLVIRGWSQSMGKSGSTPMMAKAAGGAAEAQPAAAPAEYLENSLYAAETTAEEAEEAEAEDEADYGPAFPAEEPLSSNTTATSLREAKDEAATDADALPLPETADRASLTCEETEEQWELADAEALDKLLTLLREILASEPMEPEAWHGPKGAEVELCRTYCLRFWTGDSLSTELELRGSLLLWQGQVYPVSHPEAILQLF